MSGIYIVSDVGSLLTPAKLTRVFYFNSNTNIVNDIYINVLSGTYAGTRWK
jgi:hypothetical protein